jgi:hypothetical protein
MSPNIFSETKGFSMFTVRFELEEDLAARPVAREE